MLTRLDGAGPLFLQLYRALRGAILSGKLPAGARLPSTRALSLEMGLSRNTVLLAFDQLLGEGYAVGRRGSGTYVPAELPEDMTAVVRPAKQPAGTHEPHLSRYGSTIRDWRVSWTARQTRLPYDFRYGRPSGLDFPHATWRRMVARRLRRLSPAELDYGAAAGVLELRQVLADYLQRARGVDCTPEQVLIVSGSQQGLDLTARVMLDPGDRVLLEEPHYAGARTVFVAAGAQLVSAPVDGEGLDVSARGTTPARMRLAYVTPSHQFPTGAVMSLARRSALLAWAERTGAYVIEDDYDSEFRYAGRPIESLQGLDRTGRVIYVGTFSKLLFPALRLGYLVLPEALVRPFANAKALADTGSARLEQMALADFIREGHFERHVRRSRARNGQRRAALLAAIAELLDDRVEIAGANAGLHVLLWLAKLPANRVRSLCERAAEEGVGVYPVTPFFLTPPSRAGLILGYASMTPAQIRSGIERLARVLRSMGPLARRQSATTP
jgi:GntR family transcriptional regulator/MocR family aminotransferase